MSADLSRLAPPREAERRARSARKRRDAAAVLTIVGVILFASPLVSAVGSGTGDSAVPLAVQYVFNLWAALILAAFLLARALSGPEQLDGPAAAPTDARDVHSGEAPHGTARAGEQDRGPHGEAAPRARAASPDSAAAEQSDDRRGA